MTQKEIETYSQYLKRINFDLEIRNLDLDGPRQTLADIERDHIAHYMSEMGRHHGR